jgi:hypothetical protein
MKHLLFSKAVLYLFIGVSGISFFLGMTFFVNEQMLYISIIERCIMILGLLVLTSEYLTEKEMRDSHILILNSFALGAHSLFGFATKFNLPFLMSGVGIIAIQIMLIDSLYQIHKGKQKNARKISENIDFKKRLVRWVAEQTGIRSVMFLVSKHGNYAYFIFSISDSIYQSARVSTKAQAYILLSYAHESEKLINAEENKILLEEIHDASMSMYTGDKTRRPMIPDKNLFISFSRKEIYQFNKVPLEEQKEMFREMMSEGDTSIALHVLAGVDNLSEIKDENIRNMYLDFCSIKNPNFNDIESFFAKIYDTQTVS